MSTIVRYSNAVNSLINDMFKAAYEPTTRAQTFRPAIDIVEHEKEYHLYADLAGFSKEELSITVEDSVLTISGEKKQVESDSDRYRYFERSHGSFERKFNLPDEVEPASIAAEMKNGELKIVIQKVEKVLPKKIDISIS